MSERDRVTIAKDLLQAIRTLDSVNVGGAVSMICRAFDEVAGYRKSPIKVLSDHQIKLVLEQASADWQWDSATKVTLMDFISERIEMAVYANKFPPATPNYLGETVALSAPVTETADTTGGTDAAKL